MDWPLKIWFRPGRFKYITRDKKVSGCVFCKNLQKGVCFETLLLYIDQYSFVCLNKYPYNSGHLLVLPRSHTADILKLSQEEYRGLQDTVRKTIGILQNILKPEAMNVGLNLGSHAGAGLPEHLHYHIVPRWAGDTNFLPVIAGTKVISMSMEQIYNHLSVHFHHQPT